MAEAFPSLPQNGMFELPLRASSSTDKSRFTHRIAVLEERLPGQEQCHQNAIHNLIGVLQFYMGNKVKALSQFKAVLENDAVNLNALGNSSFVYRRLGRSSKALEMENLLRKANTQEGSALRVRQGRFWAEQAHALSSEITDGKRHHDVDLEANKFYEIAFKIAGQHFEETELNAWKFSAALNYKRLSMKLDREKKDRKEWFSRSLELFVQAKNRTESPYIADCWCQIGILINAAKCTKLHFDREIPCAVKKYKLERWYEKPEDCYLKAMDMEPENWHFCNDYVRFLLNKTHKSERLQDAVKTIQLSLMLNPEQSNWFGYSTRAEVCRNCSSEEDSFLIAACKRICSLLGWDIVDKPYLKHIGNLQLLDKRKCTYVINLFRHDLLLQAEEDISNVLAWNPTTKTFSIHGQISFDVACLEKRGTLPFENKMEQALEMFQHAADMATEGKERRPHVHAAYGSCLTKIEEYRNAAEAYKLAMETSPNFSYSRSLLIQLINNLLFVHKTEPEQKVSALHEAVYWFLTVCDKYRDTRFLTTLSVDNLRDNHPEALLNMIELMKVTNFAGVLTSGLDCAKALEKKLNTAQSIARTGRNSPSAHFRGQGIESGSSFSEISGNLNRLVIDPVTGQHQNFPQPSQQSPSQLKEEAMELQSELRSVGQEVPSTSKESPHIPNKNAYPGSVSVHARDTDVDGSSRQDRVPEIGAPPPRARNRTGKTYDFFVSHSSEDKCWVYFDLIPKLEQEYNFKGCVDKRDFTPGKNVLKNIEDCMDQSVCTLLILTNAFCESNWCEHEKKEALGRRVDDNYPVIPIRVERCDLPKDLLFITYLDAVERCDWDKLVRNLDNLMEV